MLQLPDFAVLGNPSAGSKVLLFSSGRLEYHTNFKMEIRTYQYHGGNGAPLLTLCMQIPELRRGRGTGVRGP